MRFIHTADWHIGKGTGDLLNARITTAERVIETAKSYGVDFILLAGDTFEANGINRDLIQKVADILAGFKKPVYLIPGNHDPLLPGSVWEHRSWSRAENLHVVTKSEPIEIPGGTLFPCPIFEKNGRTEPTDWIDARGFSGVKIGLAHGTVPGVPQDDPEYPISTNAAIKAGLDYLALGHHHSVRDDFARMAYSGTHETTSFKETQSGYILLVEISEPGANPVIERVKTGELEWLKLNKEIRSHDDIVEVVKAIENIAEPEKTLIDITLSGYMQEESRDEVAGIREKLGSRFLKGNFDDSRLKPSQSDDTWLSGIPQGVIYEAAMRLREYCDPSCQDRPDWATPETAFAALIELRLILDEVQR
jgi:DNA repair exonuclease SbcCD nuclease subunit